MSHHGYPQFNVAEPQTKGIVRPNARRLSLAVVPLMSQRSILFRVQTELGNKEDYGELSSSSEYPSSKLLSAIPGSSSLSAPRRPTTWSAGTNSEYVSADLLSSASVYSQDSASDSPILVARARRTLANQDENRRYAMALNPSVAGWDLHAVSPSVSHLYDMWTEGIPAGEGETDDRGRDAKTPTSAALPPPEVEQIQPSKKWKNKLTRAHSISSSKPTNSLRRALSRITLQSSGELRPPPLRSQISSPVLIQAPSLPKLPDLQFSPVHISLPSSPAKADLSEETVDIESPEWQTFQRSSAAAIAPQSPHNRPAGDLILIASLPISRPPLDIPIPPLPNGYLNDSPSLPPSRPVEPRQVGPLKKNKGHRRYASSPAALKFRRQALPSTPPPPLPDLGKHLQVLEKSSGTKTSQRLAAIVPQGPPS